MSKIWLILMATVPTMLLIVLMLRQNKIKNMVDRQAFWLNQQCAAIDALRDISLMSALEQHRLSYSDFDEKQEFILDIIYTVLCEIIDEHKCVYRDEKKRELLEKHEISERIAAAYMLAGNIPSPDPFDNMRNREKYENIGLVLACRQLFDCLKTIDMSDEVKDLKRIFTEIVKKRSVPTTYDCDYMRRYSEPDERSPSQLPNVFDHGMSNWVFFVSKKEPVSDKTISLVVNDILKGVTHDRHIVFKSNVNDVVKMFPTVSIDGREILVLAARRNSDLANVKYLHYLKWYEYSQNINNGE